MRASLNNARKLVLISACLGLVMAFPCSGQSPIGDVVSSDASVSGSVITASTGTRILSGSSITAGQNPAILRLARGGEVRVCPRATVSLTNSRSNRDLVIGMGTGTIEAHYDLGSTADTVLTPDFRILLAGPGRFDLAIGADSRGNTCVRSLPADNASILVTELMGDGVYQVLPGEQAYFHNGRVANADHTVPPDCGCPQAAPVISAQSPEPPSTTPSQAGSNVPAQRNSSSLQQQPRDAQLPANSPEAVMSEHGTPMAPGSAASTEIVKSPNGEIHVQVEAPFVYRGADTAPPAPTIAHLTLRAMPSALTDTTVLPPPSAQPGTKQPQNRPGFSAKPKHKGFFGHVRSFFVSLFH
jgi:hypothetical protein